MSNELEITTDRAVRWLKEHPHRDYIDAAYAVVVAPPPMFPGDIRGRSQEAAAFSTSRWPELVAAVKQAAQRQNLLP